jgi:DNA-binding NarL/FixJ family response regulator
MKKIIVFTDQPLLAHGITSVISSAGDLELHALCESITALMNSSEARSADLLLLDMAPELTLAQLMKLRQVIPEGRVVLRLSTTVANEFLLQALEIGVRGLVPNRVSAEALLDCLRQVSLGKLWYDRALATRLLTTERIKLTRRQSQLARLVAQGLRNKEIGWRLGISEGTVKVYLSRLFTKLGLQDRLQLALYSLKNLADIGSPIETEALDPCPKSFFLDRKIAKSGGFVSSGSDVLEPVAA